jgi:sterol-4alpha-carboxylate 3-dehydrogenase (decarboxylating)
MATPNEKSIGTVLVVGGCGFVGGNLVDQLLNFPSEDNLPPASKEPKPVEKYSRESLVVTPSTTFPTLRSRYPAYSRAGTRVHALDLKCTRNRHDRAIYHECDITDEAALTALFQEIKPDVVINTASPQFTAPNKILKKVNIEGTKTLLKAAQSTGTVKAFVHTSSASVVHDCYSDLINATELYPYVYPNPAEYYSETKVVAEKAVLEANGTNGMLTCAIRPAGVVGEGDRGGFAYAIILTGSKAPAWNLNMQLGHGEGLFDNTYVGNLCYALLCATDALLSTHTRKAEGKSEILDFERVDGEAFNCTNDEPAYFWDTSRFLWSRYGRVDDVRPATQAWALPREMAVFAGFASEWVNWALGRPSKLTAQGARYACMHRYYSCEKLKKRTGYKPMVSVEEGLERSVREFKSIAEGELGKKAQ